MYGIAIRYPPTKKTLPKFCFDCGQTYLSPLAHVNCVLSPTPYCKKIKRNNDWMCNTCHTEFINYTHYLQHKLCNHDYECDWCCEMFATHEQLVDHNCKT